MEKPALLLMNVTQQKTATRMLSACLIPQVSGTSANVYRASEVMEAKVDVWQTLRHPAIFVTTATNLPRAIMTRWISFTDVSVIQVTKVMVIIVKNL